MSDGAGRARKRIKWEPAALMVLLLGLSFWLVAGADRDPSVEEGWGKASFRIGPSKGVIAIAPPDPQTGQREFVFKFRDGNETEPMTRAEVDAVFGADKIDQVLTQNDNLAFRALNITSWGGVVWVALGLIGQTLFFGRMAIQWILSERQRQSVVPAVFWYFSFGGGVLLFTYFVWRQDIVGVLGQSTGVVIYGRNIRLIMKQRRRDRRSAEQA